MGKLTLGRKVNDAVVIDVPAGEARRIVVEVADIDRNKARLRFTADLDIVILRAELLDQQPVVEPA